MRMRGPAAALAALLFAAPAMAQDGRITLWNGETLRTEPDPLAAPPARITDIQNEATLIGGDVGLFIEPDRAAPVHASNMVAVALTRRFAGRVPVSRALGAGRVFTLRPKLIASGGRVIAHWRLFDEDGAEVAAIRAAARMSGAPVAGDPFAGFTAADAARIAFQTAAEIETAPELVAAIAAANALTALAQTPSPAARPFEPAPQVGEAAEAEDAPAD